MDFEPKREPLISISVLSEFLLIGTKPEATTGPAAVTVATLVLADTTPPMVTTALSVPACTFVNPRRRTSKPEPTPTAAVRLERSTALATEVVPKYVYTRASPTDAAGKVPAIGSTELLAGWLASDAVMAGALLKALTMLPIFTATPDDLLMSVRVTIA